jgi:hypothetical protein
MNTKAESDKVVYVRRLGRFPRRSSSPPRTARLRGFAAGGHMPREIPGVFVESGSGTNTCYNVTVSCYNVTGGMDTEEGGEVR